MKKRINLFRRNLFVTNSKNRYTKIFLLFTTVFCILLLFLIHVRIVVAAESTAHLDLRVAFEDHWNEFYQKRWDILIDIMRTRINQVPAGAERDDIKKWTWEFAERGFCKETYNYFLFSDKNSPLRKEFIGIIQQTDSRLTQDFLRRIYAGYQGSPVKYDFQAFLQSAWIDLSSTMADEGTYQSLVSLLDNRGPSGDIDQYLNVLYYGYRTHSRHEGDFDSNIRKYYLDSQTLRPETISKLHSALNQNYWDGLKQKKDWMLAKSASRLYNDFPPQRWAEMDSQVVLDLANILSKANNIPEVKQVEVIEWIKKIGEDVKKNPASVPVRSLLAYFISNSNVSLRTSFQCILPLFRDDQTMFAALHDSPPENFPMKIWHGDSQNLSDCVDLLCGFFQINRAPQWETKLWDCLRDRYYVVYQGLRNRIFTTIIRPIYENHELTANPIRKRLLHETYKDKWLLDSHRYEIAHHFLANQLMTDTVAMEGRNIDVLTFTTNIYNSFAPAENQLYESESLKRKIEQIGIGFPATESERIIAYVNCVLGEPLTLMCYAFMGKTNLTKGVSFPLVAADGNSDSPQALQFEAVLRRIVELKGILKQQYATKLDRIKILEDVVNEVIRGMEEAIAKKDQRQIVTMIRLILKITVVLEDDSYLDRVLVTLRDVFGIGADAALFQKLESSTLNGRVYCFSALHSDDLVKALKAIGKIKYFVKFYDELYVPLRSIYGFFNKVGAEPYLKFINEFTSNAYEEKRNINELFEKEIENLGAIHNADGQPEYINAESAVVTLIDHYCKTLNINLWEKPKTIALSKNINLGVIYRLLNEKGSNGWELKGMDDQNRARCYRTLAEVFLENVENPNMMSKPVNLYEPPALYSKWDFFSFLRSMTDLYEILGYPIPGKAPATLYEGTPCSKDGVKRAILKGSDKLLPRKVNGSLRAVVVEKFKDMKGVEENEYSDKCEEMVKLALLLPNKEENNEGDRENLGKYYGIKKDVYEMIRMLLNKEKAKLYWLLWLCRLEASEYGLANDRGFNYEQDRTTHYRDLGTTERTTLSLEEFRLIQINQSKDREAITIVELAQKVLDLANKITKNYDLVGGRFDPISRAILEFYRKTNPKSVLENLKEEDVFTLWVLTTMCRDALEDAASNPQNLNEAQKAAVVTIISSLYAIHSYFMPFVDSGFNINSLFELEYALPMFCMLDCNVKKPTVKLLQIYETTWPAVAQNARSDANRTEMLEMLPCELQVFLICHNFLPLSLLKTSLEIPERFLTLVEGKEVKVTTYNFRLLWEREDKATISFEHLCEEVMNGIDCNKDILMGAKELDDRGYIEYFFGDMWPNIDTESKFKREMSKNFDAVVRELAQLPGDSKRLDNLQKAIETKLRQETDSAKLDRLNKALNEVKSIKDRIGNILGQGYEYFGRILAEKLHSIFAVQRTCELAGDKIAKAKQDLASESYKLYSEFYNKGLFVEGTFIKRGKNEHEALYYAMIEKFYLLQNSNKTLTIAVENENTAEPAFIPYNISHGESFDTSLKKRERKEFSDEAFSQYQQRYWLLIDGTVSQETNKWMENQNLNESEIRFETDGVMVTARKPVEIRTEFDKLYLSSFLGLFQGLFCGDGLDKGISFIGSVAWDKDTEGNPTIIPLDYDRKEDEIRSLLRWIYESAKKYEKIPELRQLFVESDFAVSENLE
ncbi:MAG TPA: hypothetical protein ACFYD6_11360 [Candidatus Brocadiia bacterium]|nr:hypothetical protein [Candidatus Brocadiales bacterium]